MSLINRSFLILPRIQHISVAGFRFEEKYSEPLTQVLLTVHFSAALKALVLGNLFKVKVFRLDITFAQEGCHLEIKMKRI